MAGALLFASCNGRAKFGSKVIEWPADDQVLVVNNGGVFKPDYVAISPKTNAEGVANVIDGFEVTFFLPSTQAYCENSYAEKTMPKVAYSIGEAFQFKHVLGGLCLPLGGDGMRVSKVVLSSTDIDEALWGTCLTTVSTTDGDPESKMVNTETGRNTITLDCGEGIILNDSIPTNFCFAVPAGSLESGFVMEVYDGDKKIFEKRTTTAPGSGFISRNTMRKLKNNLEIFAPADR